MSTQQSLLSLLQQIYESRNCSRSFLLFHKQVNSKSTPYNILNLSILDLQSNIFDINKTKNSRPIPEQDKQKKALRTNRF